MHSFYIVSCWVCYKQQGRWLSADDMALRMNLPKQRFNKYLYNLRKRGLIYVKHKVPTEHRLNKFYYDLTIQGKVELWLPLTMWERVALFFKL